MALIKCTECGKKFSDKATACPKCGCPTDFVLKEIKNIEIGSFNKGKLKYLNFLNKLLNLKKNKRIISILLVSGILLSSFLFTKLDQNSNPITENTEMTLKELRSIMLNDFQSNYYIVGDINPLEYLSKIRNNYHEGMSPDIWFESVNYESTNAIIIDNEYLDNFMQMVPGIESKFNVMLPEIFDIEADGIYVIDKNGTYFIYFKTRADDYQKYIDEIYSLDSENDLDIYFISTNSDFVPTETNSNPVENEEVNKVESIDMSNLAIDQVREVMKNNNFEYVIADQGPAEYLYTYSPGIKGTALVIWLNSAGLSTTTSTIFVDNSTNSFGLNNSDVKEKMMNFLPEIYEITENGIYVIDNDGTLFIYIKTNVDDYQDYIDYLYKDTDKEFSVYSLSSATDNLEDLISDPVYEIYPILDFYHQAIYKGSKFNGFFYNIDHSDPSVFLNNGSQTQNNNHQNILDQFNNKKDLSTLMEIYKYISAGAFQNSSDNTIDKFARSVDEIMDSKVLTGCTDYGLVFASITRDKGIPTIFLQTARVDWIYERLRNISNGIVGHILIEVYIDGKWRLIDSTAGRYYPDYDYNDFSLNDGYYVFSKSIEVLDSGIKSEQHNFEVMMETFKHFNIEAYKDPVYDYIDLRSGNSVSGKAFEFGQYTVTKASDTN